jgi:hypothetical protein
MQTASTQAAALHQASGGRFGRTGDVLLQMQRQYGNGYVQQVVSRAREAATLAIPDSATADAVPAVQAKLLLGPPRDRYEQAADQVAAAATGHRLSQHWQAAEGSIQPPYGMVDAPVAQALAQERGGGQPLPAPLRQSMEQSLGADFGGVRVHTGGRSDQLNQSLQAAAFTAGNDIFFRRGAYVPAGSRGRALLAHELTHVVQQRSLRRRAIQRYFDPPANPNLQVPKPPKADALAQKPARLSQSPGWAISKVVEATNELQVPHGVLPGHKVMRFTALLTPSHANFRAGAPTQQGTNPIGWSWIERNEVRTASGKLRYWVRFHLLNAKLGGKGYKERHLVPTTKTANARWDRGIERQLAAALKGGSPVYYDVTLTYWPRGQAPESYVDQATHTDYKDNITLFPKSITGNWQRFERNRWVPQQGLTVTVDQPRGIGGDEVDLSTHLNLKLVANLFHINLKILELLQGRYRRVTPAGYGAVRDTLETWAMAGATDNEKAKRQQAIYESEGYLRTALAGRQSFRLKFNGQHVPDDATPEAKMFGPPVHAVDYRNLDDYENVAGPFTVGYTMAQAASGDHFPAFEDVLWLMMTQGPLNRVTLPEVQQLWDTFKATNEMVPPMSGTQLVPDQDEMRFVLERRTKQQVVQRAYELSAQKVKNLYAAAEPVMVAQELATAVDVNYSQLLQQAFGNLTVEQVRNVPMLTTVLLNVAPVRQLSAELDARVAEAPDLLRLGIAGHLSANPFIQTLGVSMAGEMRQKIKAEQRRLAPPPQPVQHQPTGRSRIPTGTLDRPQAGTLPIINVSQRVHSFNHRLMLALPGSVRHDRRYPANQAGQQEAARRMRQILGSWDIPQRVPGQATFSQEINRALDIIFFGLLSAFR